MRSKRDSLILSALIVSVLLIASVSAFWPFTGNAVDSGSRPLIVSVSPDESVRNASVHEQISFSFTAADMDSDMNHIWMQVWKAPSTSNPSDFVTPESGYNNPNGFYTGAPQGVQTASSNIFTFSLSTPGTYYVRFAVRDIASPTLTETWKTVNVGGKGAVCGAQDQCVAGLSCTNRICNDPSSADQFAGLCQTCTDAVRCASGMYCDSFSYGTGTCRYNPGNIGESCQRAPAVSSACGAGSLIKPCVSGLHCTVSSTAFDVNGAIGVCQNTSVGLGQRCDANNICSSGLVCDSSDMVCTNKPIINSFNVENDYVVQGTNLKVSVNAAKTIYNLKRHRLYVEGSSNGAGSAWTNLSASMAEVRLGDSIPTLNNSKSFFRGAGLYNLVYEIEDVNGNIAMKRLLVVVSDPAQGQPSANITCSDTDNGLNYYVKGNLTSSAHPGAKFEEYCLNTTTLIERHCLSTDPSNFTLMYTCAYGCSGGACLAADQASFTVISASTPIEANSGMTLEEATRLMNQQRTTNATGSSSIACSDGCLSPSLQNCYSAGYRTDSAYCDIDARQMTAQKESGASCNNDFECSSNVCAASQCVDAGLFQRILDWFRNLGTG